MGVGRSERRPYRVWVRVISGPIGCLEASRLRQSGYRIVTKIIDELSELVFCVCNNGVDPEASATGIRYMPERRPAGRGQFSNLVRTRGVQSRNGQVFPDRTEWI